MNIHIADDAVAVDDEDGAFASTVFTQHTVQLSDPSVRIKVAQERISDPFQAICPGNQGWLAIYTQTQDLGPDPIEPAQFRLVRWDLAGSDRGPG